MAMVWFSEIRECCGKSWKCWRRIIKLFEEYYVNQDIQGRNPVFIPSTQSGKVSGMVQNRNLRISGQTPTRVQETTDYQENSLSMYAFLQLPAGQGTYRL